MLTQLPIPTSGRANRRWWHVINVHVDDGSEFGSVCTWLEDVDATVVGYEQGSNPALREALGIDILSVFLLLCFGFSSFLFSMFGGWVVWLSWRGYCCVMCEVPPGWCCDVLCAEQYWLRTVW